MSIELHPRPRPKGLKHEKPFREKLANWMRRVGLNNPQPTTFRPTIVRGDGVGVSDGGEVYHIPETLFYENVKKWAGGGGSEQVKLVPRSVDE